MNIFNFYLLLLTISVIGNIITIGLIFSYFDSTKVSEQMKIQTNWQRGIITYFNISNSEICTKGNKTIFGEWLGAYSGCYCPTTDILYEGACDNFSTCNSTKEIPAKKIFRWKNTTICQENKGNYLDLKLVNFTDDCSSGEKQCGLVDTFFNKLCLPINETCPLNFLEIFPQGKEIPKDGKLYNTIDLIDGNRIVYSNDFVENEIINEFTINDNYPCVNKYERNSEFPVYPLEKNFELNNTFCETNIIFKKIDSDKYKNLYENNGILNSLKNLPKFSEFDYTNNYTNLFSGNFLGID